MSDGLSVPFDRFTLDEIDNGVDPGRGSRRELDVRELRLDYQVCFPGQGLHTVDDLAEYVERLDVFEGRWVALDPLE